MSSTHRTSRRLAAALLLVGVLAHSGDGLMAALCAPGGVGHGAPTGVAAGGHGQPADVSSDAGHEAQDAAASPDGVDEAQPGAQKHVAQSDDSHSGDCPFGGDPSAACGSAATAPAFAVVGPPVPLSVPFALRPQPVHRVAGHVGEPPFRPPRG